MQRALQDVLNGTTKNSRYVDLAMLEATKIVRSFQRTVRDEQTRRDVANDVLHGGAYEMLVATSKVKDTKKNCRAYFKRCVKNLCNNRLKEHGNRPELVDPEVSEDATETNVHEPIASEYTRSNAATVDKLAKEDWVRTAVDKQRKYTKGWLLVKLFLLTGREPDFKKLYEVLHEPATLCSEVFEKQCLFGRCQNGLKEEFIGKHKDNEFCCKGIVSKLYVKGQNYEAFRDYAKKVIRRQTAMLYADTRRDTNA